jgi:hypothetical protein
MYTIPCDYSRITTIYHSMVDSLFLSENFSWVITTNRLCSLLTGNRKKKTTRSRY